MIQNKFVFIINGNNNTLINNYLKNKKNFKFFLSEASFLYLFLNNKKIKTKSILNNEIEVMEKKVNQFLFRKHKIKKIIDIKKFFDLSLNDINFLKFFKPRQIIGNLYLPQSIYLSNKLCPKNKISVDHGNDIYSKKNPFCLYSSLGTDKFLCGSLIAKKNIKENIKNFNQKQKKIFPQLILETNEFFLKNKIKIKDNVYKNKKKNLNRILFIGHPLTFNRQIFYDKNYFLYFLGLEKKIANFLKKKQFKIDYSMHQGATVWSKYISKNFDEIIFKDSEELISNYDMIIFTNTFTTMFNYVLMSSLPVLVFNYDLHLWKKKDLNILKKRVGIVKLTYNQKKNIFNFSDKEFFLAKDIAFKSNKNLKYREHINFVSKI